MNNINTEQNSFLEKLIYKAEDFLPKELDLTDLQMEKFIKTVQIFFLAKYIRTFKALLLLVDNDFGEDAAILQRSLCEIWIKFLHLEKYGAIDNWLYLRQCGIYELNVLENLRKLTGEKLPDASNNLELQSSHEQSILKIIEKIEEVNPNLGLKCREDFSKNSGLSIIKNRNIFWPGKHLLDLLSESNEGSKWVYDYGYSIPSDYLHSNPGIIGRYLELSGQKVYTQLESNQDFGYNELLHLASGFLIDILAIYDKLWNVNKQNEIEVLQKNLSEVFRGG